MDGVPGRSALRLLRTGVELEDGLSAPAKVGVVGDVADTVLRIVIHEGRNRQVRRMCEAVGHPVKRLVRVRVGPIVLRGLEPGSWRELTARSCELSTRQPRLMSALAPRPNSESR